MSIFVRNNSSKNIFNRIPLSINSNLYKRNNSVEKDKKDASVKSLYMKDDKKYNKDLSILHYIMTRAGRKYSIKTAFSDNITQNEIMNYDLAMINKYEENLNSSFSFISDFDLEEENDDKEDSSFNSENDDNSFEEIIINTKYTKQLRTII